MDGQKITLDDLKANVKDYLSKNALMQIEHGLINDDEFADMLIEIEDIDNMTAEKFYDWWNLVREVVRK